MNWGFFEMFFFVYYLEEFIIGFYFFREVRYCKSFQGVFKGGVVLYFVYVGIYQKYVVGVQLIFIKRVFVYFKFLFGLFL